MSELHIEGLQYMLEAAFSEEQSPPANFYIGLAQDVSLDEDAALSGITEVAGSGYSRQAVASDNVDFTSAVGDSSGANDRKITTKTVTFTATGTWATAKMAFLATSIDNSGKLVASEVLSQNRTLLNGETLQIAFEIDLLG